ncbi:transferrin-binding protein-like solute binding protein [Moraxella sp.]|uniref:transferrin-binding protein-like solute binding protein n=1 Tax=Moraxella sp. TaxID=479 RepID=UPI0026DDC3CA|nr:transferrin-binding protein-like solute binding protein [Moraxella sp.]MDO4894747.1 transferrin-binding protein-like solute binding protein [Moraxella sp.]
MPFLSCVTRFTPLPLVLAISTALLSACGGGGFGNPAYIESGLNPSVTPKPADTPKPTDESAQDNPSPQTLAIIQPTLGNAIAITKRNLYANAEAEKKINVDELLPIDAQSIKELTEKLGEKYPNKTIYQNDKTNQDYQFVKAGWVFSELYSGESVIDAKNNTRYQAGDGYVYYYGDKPTMGIAKGEAKYLGHWDFMTNAKHIRRKIEDDKGVVKETVGGGSAYGMDDKFGDHVGATSFAESYFQEYSPRQGHHKAQFLVNFDDKRLTGKLSTQKKTSVNEDAHEVDRYDINATIRGNRFMGSATVPKDQKGNNSTLFYEDATGRLEGGFYGDKAQELAGKFLTDDDSVFGVFAAKQAGQVQALAQSYDTLYVDTTNDASINARQLSSLSSFTILGDVRQLSINDKVIDLLPQNDQKFAQQSVDLPTGQKAIITNFGTADGVLTLGHLTKTGVNNKKTAAQALAEKQAQAKQALAEKIANAKVALANSQEAARQKFADKITELRDDLSANVYDYLLEEDADTKNELQQTIIEQVFAGHTQHTEAQKKQILTWLDRLDRANLDEHEEFLQNNQFIEDIIKVFDAGEKFNVNDERNWQEFFEIDDETLTLATAGDLLNRYELKDITQAKEKFKERAKNRTQEFDDLLAEYESGEIELSDLTKKATKQLLAVYDKNQHKKVKSTLNHLFAQLKMDEANGVDDEELEDDAPEENSTLLAIAGLFKKGDKLDPSKQKNWQAYLPKSPTIAPPKPVEYGPQAIKLAQNQLKAKLIQEQEELGDLLGEYPDLVLLPQIGLADANESSQTRKAFLERIEAKILAYYASDKHPAIKAQISQWLAVIDEAVAVAVKELDAAGNIESKRQAVLKKLEQAVITPQETLAKLILAGEKADVNNQENLQVFLAAMPVVEEMDINQSNSGFYVMGERTPLSQIPTQGQAHYQGTWHGKIHNDRSWETTPGQGVHDSKALFDVDFDNKALTGQLLEKGASDATFNINAKIIGNTFTGKAIANEKGIYLDKYLDIAGGVIKQNPVLDDNLQGGFYGKDAEYLAGGFSFDGKLERYDDSTTSNDKELIVEPIIGGGVFYGTKDKKVKQK